MEAETLRGVAAAVDPPAAPLQDRLDVRALDVVERVRRRRAGAAAERLKRIGSSSCSVSPVEAIIARSTTFSSSRTLPGQE